MYTHARVGTHWEVYIIGSLYVSLKGMVQDMWRFTNEKNSHNNTLQPQYPGMYLVEGSVGQKVHVYHITCPNSNVRYKKTSFGRIDFQTMQWKHSIDEICCD